MFILHSCSKKQKVTSLNVSLEKDLEIGVSEGDENYMFGGIIDVEVDSRENIYVLDWKNKTVKKYGKN
jgi:ATP-dependent exoDNAse (exonuclease V) beta subunit